MYEGGECMKGGEEKKRQEDKKERRGGKRQEKPEEKAVWNNQTAIEDASTKPVVGSLVHMRPTHASVAGNKLPSSLIRSLMLNLRLLSTTKQQTSHDCHVTHVTTPTHSCCGCSSFAAPCHVLLADPDCLQMHTNMNNLS